MSVVYFTDRDLGKQFPQILRHAGLTVERHDDHFSPRTRDEEWLAEVGRRGWVAISHDRRIRYKPNEHKAVRDHGVALLVVIGDTAFENLAHSFVATRHRIERFITQHAPPYIAKVYRGQEPMESADTPPPGRIELWYP